MIRYTYTLFRPPAEADNLILQITNGCSYNKCTFCSMYKEKKYSQKELEDIFDEIDKISLQYPNTTKIFLADGDALSIKTDKLLEILEHLNQSFKYLRRVSLYASAQNILHKSDDDLEKLYNHKLTLIYFGIETGDDTILRKINKGVNSNDIINSLNKASKAKIKISATIILGLGGIQLSKRHILYSAHIVNSTRINYLSTLQLGLEDDIKDTFYKYFDNFKHLNDFEILDEQKRLIEAINPSNKIIFRSNHASNAIHLSGNLPKDKNKLLKQIELSLEIGEDALIPKFFRGF